MSSTWPGATCAPWKSSPPTPGLLVCNLGTGQGYSVLEMVRAFERVSGRPIPYDLVARRPGDIAICYADPDKARALLGWSAELGLDDMVRDAWRWQSSNPDGYGEGLRAGQPLQGLDQPAEGVAVDVLDDHPALLVHRQVHAPVRIEPVDHPGLRLHPLVRRGAEALGHDLRVQGLPGQIG